MLGLVGTSAFGRGGGNQEPASQRNPNTRVEKPILVFRVVRCSRSCIVGVDATTAEIFRKSFRPPSPIGNRNLSCREIWSAYGSTWAEDSDRTDRTNRHRRLGSATPRVPH